MSREIRITIADDEVFERMRHRKETLDISWEEALRRGLDTEADATRGTAPTPFDDDFREQLRDRIRSSVREDSRGAPSNATPAKDRGPVIDGDAIRDMVTAHIEHALPDFTTSGPAASPLDAELDALADAEDAVLSFPAVEGEHATVPLRVNLTTGGDGLDVEVVAVRRGKDTDHRNVFDPDDREQLTTALATGTPATLAFQGGAETYDVIPSLSWGRTSEGHPTVVEVTIEAVRLED